mgnify:CR=1 FL=1
MEKPNLHSASFKFSQEGNTNGTTSEYEDLDISFESSLGLDFDGDGFYVLRTEGWSVDGGEDLQELYDRIKKIMLDKK